MPLFVCVCVCARVTVCGCVTVCVCSVLVISFLFYLCRYIHILFDAYNSACFILLY